MNTPYIVPGLFLPFSLIYGPKTALGIFRGHHDLISFLRLFYFRLADSVDSIMERMGVHTGAIGGDDLAGVI